MVQLNLEQAACAINARAMFKSEHIHSSESTVPFETPFALCVLARGMSSSEELIVAR